MSRIGRLAVTGGSGPSKEEVLALAASFERVDVLPVGGPGLHMAQVRKSAPGGSPARRPNSRVRWAWSA
jgi:hypothetical protein